MNGSFRGMNCNSGGFQTARGRSPKPSLSRGSLYNVSKKSKGKDVIPNQSSDWCGNPPVKRKNYRFRNLDV